LTRHVLKSDLPAVTETLSRAFFDDPVMAWVFEQADERLEQLRAWMGLSLDAGATRGHLYTVGDRRAAALWSPPDVTIFDDFWGPQIASLMTELIGDEAGPKLRGLMRMVASHPPEPHFYLMILGTHPESQGEGLGGALLEPLLERCDAQGLVAYLESSNARNLPFYERHGFEVMGEVEVADDGPVVHPMQRKPR
jgi:ribosomal protein S18 acetylase RimI-like enzyme